VALTGAVVAALGFMGVLTMQRFGVRSKVAYIAPAFVAWAGTYAAGIHPTIAGVMIGFLTPVRAWLGPHGFARGVRAEVEHLSRVPTGSLSAHKVSKTLHNVDLARREALSPTESLIETLHPYVAFGIMPLFALANAGVVVRSGTLSALSWSVIMAVTLGLVVGKPLGILLACWLTLRLRLGKLPAGVGYRHLVVLGGVAGVGFTMALFIAQLAFTDARLLSAAKLGVLAASGIAAIVGLVLGRLLLAPTRALDSAQTADEAESSTDA
jgi:NhaA family Na+:H+ antiporter